MNPVILVPLLLFFVSTINAQDINQEVILENGQPILVGHINTEGLSTNSYQAWYSKNHDTYKQNSKITASFEKTLAKHKILVFMGTWCGDSKREVPRFIKILEEAGFPKENLKIVGVDRRKEQYKKSPTGEEWALSIKRVPTFIFYKDGKEVNRIIESPITTLEADIATIVNGKSYTPNYPTSLHFD